jgi:hypothetical protein
VEACLTFRNGDAIENNAILGTRRLMASAELSVGTVAERETLTVLEVSAACGVDRELINANRLANFWCREPPLTICRIPNPEGINVW